jgi:hypothetical protein
VASRLYEIAAQTLRARGVRSLSTEASIEARPFFESKEFNIVEEQVVERNGVKQNHREHKNELECIRHIVRFNFGRHGGSFTALARERSTKYTRTR